MKTWPDRFLRKAFATAIAACLSLCAVDASWAQASPQASRASTQPAASIARAPDVTPTQLASAGEEVLRLIDQSRYADLWNSASTATRKVARQTQFNADLVNNRSPLGAVTTRNWVLLARQTLGEEKGAIAGDYLNIEYETRFAKGEQRRELVSFRFDEDRVWRFAGYVLH